MHLRRSIAVASLAAATTAFLAVAAGASTLASYDFPPLTGPWSLAPGEYYAELSGSSFQTSGAFDADGNRVGLGSSLQRRAFASNVELGWKKTVSFQVGVPLVTNSTSAAGGASQTGLEDFSVGLRWTPHTGPRCASVQLRWEAPAGYNRALQPAIGDGLQKLSATLQVGGPAGKQAFWQLGGGLRLQYKALTDLQNEIARNPSRWKWPEHMVTNGAAGFWAGRLQVAGLFASDLSSFRLGGEAEKATSVAIGSRLTYRLDARMDTFAGSWHTPSGKNSLAVNEYYAGIAWKSTKLGRLQGFLGGDARP
jgi:hypothetical protein